MRYIAICSILLWACFLTAQTTLFTPEILWSLGRVSLEAASDQNLVYSVKKFEIKTGKDSTEFYFCTSNEEDDLFDLPSGCFGKPPYLHVKLLLPSTASHLQFNGSFILFLSDGFLFQYDFSTCKIKQLSEFKINDYDLSQNGKTLVYTQDVKYKQTSLERHPDIPNANFLVIDSLYYRPLKTWGDEFNTNLFTTPFETGKSLKSGINIMKNQPYDVITFDISPDGNFVVYESKKVNQDEQASSTNTDIYLYDTKKLTTINITKGMDGYDKDPVFSPDGQHIAWSSMSTPIYETDLKRLMVYNLLSSQSNEITKGFDYNVSSPQWQDNTQLVFQTEMKGTTQLFRGNLKGETTQITKGTHTIGDKFILDKDRIFFTKSTYITPPDVFELGPNSSVLQMSAVNTKAISNIRFGKIEERFTPTFDGKILQSWVIYPPDFDPKKSYPCILYCQGGPQSALTNGWSLRWSLTLLAAQGYIIIAPNRRGVFGFGSEWTRAVSQNWGDEPMKDLLAAIDDISKEPYIDKSRRAAIGASFGGYSVYWLAGNHENRFKCFFAHAGLYNLTSFEGMTDEKFFVDYDMGGSYFQNWNNPTYTQYSPHLYTARWNRPILITQGGSDYRVLDAEAFQAFDAAKKKGLDARMIYFPKEGHGIQNPSNSIVWYREVIGWLKVHL
jgi:dipeptidyl aminopeptidase/acylaminoacyl peptidase